MYFKQVHGAAVGWLVVLCVCALWLITGLGGCSYAAIGFTRKPSSTAGLQFAGFIVLPKTNQLALLSVMDYMSVHDRQLFVASIEPGAVFKIPLGSGPLPPTTNVAVLEGKPSAHGVTFDPVSQLGFVSRSGTDTVDVFDARTMRQAKSIPVAPGVDGIFIDPFNKLLYAVSGEHDSATLIDPASQTRVGTIPLGGSPEYAVFDPTTHRLYQNLIDKSTLVAVDLAKRSVVDRWPLAGCRGPAGIDLDAARRRLFIACRKNAALAVFSLESHTVTATIDIGAGADSVAYDAQLRRIYTTGRSGVLSTILQEQPDRYRKLDDIALAFGAHTLAVDPLTHRVYVGYVSVLIAPRIAVFDASPQVTFK